MAVVAPVKLTVAPDPPAPLIVPLMVKVCAELKFAVPFAPLMVTAWLAGVMMKPFLPAVTVYEPLAKALKVYAPEEFAVVVAPAVPLRITVAPLPPAPLIVPVMEKVCATELKLAVAFAPLTVMGWLEGVMTKPLLVGVTVYDPLAKPVKL